MPKLAFSLALALALLGIALPARADLGAAMSATLAAQQLSGAVWATVAEDGQVSTGAAGLSHAPRGTALLATDRVHIGSITKTLLATGILRLVSQGRLALDAPVTTLLPGLAFDNAWAASDPVRLRHLLDHTAGLDDARFSQVFSLQATPDTPLAAAFDRGGAAALAVRSRPGARASYSNSGYALLGRVIEAVTDERYETWLARELLRPLGMADSTFGFVSQEGAQADARLAYGHFDGGAAQAALPIWLRPAGQFSTTAADMGVFARFLMGDGRLADQPFIDTALLRAMGSPEGSEAARAGLTIGHALGLATRDRHGAVGRCHGGDTVGYRAMLCVFPAQRRAFFRAVNMDSETADYGALDRLLVQALSVASSPATPAASVSACPAGAAWAGFYVPAPNRFASLAWMDTVLGTARLVCDGERLRFGPMQAAAQDLTPLGGGLFRAPGRLLASHVLLVTGDGERLISTGSQTYRLTPLTVLLPLWASLVLGLLGLGHLFIAGIVRTLRRRWAEAGAGLIGFIGVLALLLPLPLFMGQSFLALGDPTPASLGLAAVSAALPMAMLGGLLCHWQHRPRGWLAALDAAAMLAVLQFAGVLAAWGLLPLRLWA